VKTLVVDPPRTESTATTQLLAQPSPGAGRYRRIAELGRGGMATVFLCVAEGPAGFNKLQVLKYLRPDFATDPELLEMFLEEARIAARINHPNVVQTYEVGCDGELPYIAMEYVDGQPLESLIRRARRKDGAAGIPLRLHLEILVHALAGLHFAHELEDFDGRPLALVHRDVSPHNVMVTYEGHVKVLDFGIAKAADSSHETRAGLMKGKYSYMSPEQYGGHPIDRRADVYAAGVMLWQAITGRSMWQGLKGSQILPKVVSGEIPRPQDLQPGVDEALAGICMKALAMRPEDRYATAAELEVDVESYLQRTGRRPTERELGQYVSELARESRAKIRVAIEAQVRKPTDSTPADLPVLWAPEASSRSGVRSTPHGVQRAGTSTPPPPRRSLVVLGSIGAGVLALLATTAAVVAMTMTAHGLRPVPSASAPVDPASPAAAATGVVDAVIAPTAPSIVSASSSSGDDAPVAAGHAPARPAGGIAHMQAPARAATHPVGAPGRTGTAPVPEAGVASPEPRPAPGPASATHLAPASTRSTLVDDTSRPKIVE
jgi:serine/threonine protein kinase